MPRVRDSLPGRSPIWIDDGDDPRGISSADAISALVGETGLPGLRLEKDSEGWIRTDSASATAAPDP